MRLRNRPGATLTEVIITLVVLGVFGAGLSRLMTSQSRFLHNNEGLSEARRVARSGVDVLLGDLRAIDPDSGIVSATATSLTMRVPWRTGISCGNGGTGSTHVVMPPVDSLLYVFGTASVSGQAYVDATGLAHYTTPSSSVGTGNYGICQAEAIDTIPGGQLISITPEITGATPGRPVFQFQDITYSFATSWDHWPQLGLFRTIVALGWMEEVASPFDSTATFRYFINGSTNPVANPTSSDYVIGVDLAFIGLNRRNTTAGKTLRAPVETAVYFKNR
jgi:type II secretory pathway pseudopilin PulG